MTDDAALVGDSSTHDADEVAPDGGFFRHRLTIRFTNGETLALREAFRTEACALSLCQRRKQRRAFCDNHSASVALAAPFAFGRKAHSETFRSVPQISAFGDNAAAFFGFKFYINAH